MTLDFNTLWKLEESLWNNETRFDKNYMDSILAPDFFEFGRSGRIYKREDTLGVSKDEALTEYTLKNFQARQIDEKVFLVTYVSRVMFDELEIANRSPIWLRPLKDGKFNFIREHPHNY